MDDLPPPYTASQSTTTPSFTPSSLTTHLTSHLSILPSRIRATADRHQTAQQATDLALVTLIVPHIESFLSDLGTTAPPPSSRGTQRAELTLVPEKAVPAPWQMSGAAERRREGENVSLVRIEVEGLGNVSEKGGKGGDGDDDGGGKGRPRDEKRPMENSSGQRDYTMDAWGRWDEPSASTASGPGSWWFADEDMARRLAGHLSPAPAVRAERRDIAEVVQTAKEERSRWGFGRKKETAPPAPAVTRREEKRPVVEIEDEKVSMTVRAEEVTFGKENEFGVWESMTGWGLVVRVRMRI